MDGFGSDFSAGGSGGKMDTGTIMEQVKVQIAVANAQELLQRMTDKCFKKCIGKPGSTLDNSEQCLLMLWQEAEPALLLKGLQVQFGSIGPPHLL
uniref:Mitochondrial import inner membrane translocase subunit n=1 Tax=Neolamprologus brichardi TaxID=32507 RepID=A0A3Q4HIL0_NEOBR